MCSRRLIPLLPAAALLLAAGPVVPDDWLAQGDAALAAGDVETALTHYRRAAERTADPGRAAFNQAVCLYHLGRYRDAELLFRCALDDAGVGDDQGRRARALYNLGNCLLKQSAGLPPARARAWLRDAITCYELGLADPHTDGELLIDARHNLELAKLLRQKARAADDAPDREDDRDRPPPPQPDPPGGEPPGPFGQRPDGSPGRTQPQPGAAPETGPDGQSNPSPGAGHLPPIPDSEKLAPLSPEDLQAHLKAAEERIRREREQRLRPQPVVPPAVRNW